MSDLLERLHREYGQRSKDVNARHVFAEYEKERKEAADRISQIEAELDEAASVTKAAVDQFDSACAEIKAQAQRIAELENHIADAGKMVEAQAKEIAELRAALADVQDACGNVVIAFGMGWDMGGTIAALRERLAASPVKRLPQTEEARTNFGIS